MVQIVVASYLRVVVSRVLVGVGAMGTMAPIFWRTCHLAPTLFGKNLIE